MLKLVMARRRRLKKGGDLKIQKQNVVSSKSKHGEQNVVPSELRPREQNVVLSKLRIDESNNLCGLELTMMTVCNSNDEITFNTYWEFRSRNGGLDYFRIYIHWIKCK
jgi:hypothetical protein